jgi:hypothetical protein
LDPISSLSTEAAAGNIVRVEGGLKLERILSTRSTRLRKHHVYIASTGPSARYLVFDALV